MPPDDSDDWRQWRREINKRLKDGDERFGRIEKLAAERYQVSTERHREIMGALDGIRAKLKARSPDRELGPYVDDSDEVSSIQDIEELRGRSRRLRRKAQQFDRMQKWGKYAAPFLIGFGAGIWELFQRTVLK